MDLTFILSVSHNMWICSFHPLFHPQFPNLCDHFCSLPGRWHLFISFFFYCPVLCCFWPFSLSSFPWCPYHGHNMVTIWIFPKYMLYQRPSSSSHLTTFILFLLSPGFSCCWSFFCISSRKFLSSANWYKL